MAEYDTELSRIVAQMNQAVSGPEPDTKSVSTSSLEQLLALAAKRGASDLLIIAGNAPVMRIQGELAPAVGQELSAEDIRNLVLPLLETSQYEELQRRKAVDVSFVAPGAVELQEGLLDQVRMVLLTNCTFDGVVYNPTRVMHDILAIKPDICF